MRPLLIGAGLAPDASPVRPVPIGGPPGGRMPNQPACTTARPRLPADACGGRGAAAGLLQCLKASCFLPVRGREGTRGDARGREGT